MSEFEVWLYRGVIAALLGLVWYFIQAGFSGVRRDIHTLINEIKSLTSKTATYDEKFAVINHRFNDSNSKIENLEDKVRNLELEQAGCRFKPSEDVKERKGSK